MERFEDQDPLRDAGRAINDALGDLKARLDDALDGAECPLDPDATLEGLEECATALCRSLSTLDAELENADRAASCDLNSVVSAVIDRLTDAAVAPVIVRTQLDLDVSSVPVTVRALTSIVERIVGLAMTFAGSGGEICIRSDEDAGVARLGIEAIYGGESREATIEDPALPFESAMGFATELGGTLDVTVDAAGGQLDIELRFASLTVDDRY